MKTFLTLMVSAACFATAVPSHAHFLWAVGVSQSVSLEVADQPGKGAAPNLFPRIAVAKRIQLGAPKESPDKKSALAPPKPGAVACGACLVYGIHDDFLVNWSAKAILSLNGTEEAIGLPAEILLRHGSDGLKAQVLRSGKPAAGAEVLLWTPGERSAKKLKTDPHGEAVLGLDHGSIQEGLLAVAAIIVVPGSGKHDGHAYRETRYFTTATLLLKMP